MSSPRLRSTTLRSSASAQNCATRWASLASRITANNVPAMVTTPSAAWHNLGGAGQDGPMTTLANRPNQALLVVDVQNGVVAGSPRRDAVVSNIATLVDKARDARVPV